MVDVKCKVCTKEKIEGEILRGVESEGIISLPLFLPTFVGTHVCSCGCGREIGVEEWYEAEKNVLKKIYGEGLLGKIRKFMFIITYDKNRTLRLADDFLDELKPYLRAEI